MSDNLGNDIRSLLDELMDLLDETDTANKGPVFARIDELHLKLEDLINETIDKKKPEYDAAIGDVTEATSAVKDARKRLVNLDDALKVVDQAVGGITKLVEALT